MCHEERDGVFELLAELGARPVDVAVELTELVPRLQDAPAARLTSGRAQPGGRGHQADRTSSRRREHASAAAGTGRQRVRPWAAARRRRPGISASAGWSGQGACRIAVHEIRPSASAANSRIRSVRNASSDPAGASATGPVGR